jgi:hypothetical protein
MKACKACMIIHGAIDYKNAIPVATLISDAELSGAEEVQSRHTEHVIKPIERTSLDKLELLKKMGMPQGLAEALARASELTARRYWIVDNSGSMNTQDGKRVLVLNESKIVSCSRWEELGDSLRWQGQVASILGAHTEFRLMNQPQGLAIKSVVVGGGENGNEDEAALDTLDTIINSKPAYKTPLCEVLRKVHSKNEEHQEKKVFFCSSSST